MRSTFVLALLTVCAVGCSGPGTRYCGDLVSGAGVEPGLTYQVPTAKSVLEVAPAQMPEVVRDAHRLRPDRRFLLAIAEIDCLMSGAPPGELRSTFQDGKWAIHYRDELVGELPEVPDFSDAAALLGIWTERLAVRHPIEFRERVRGSDVEFVQERLNEFEAASIAQAMLRLEQRWRKSGPQQDLLALAASGLVRITVQSLDWLEIADRVAAKALAVTIMSKTLTPLDVTREEALLSYEMDYSTHAARMGESLPEHDPVRLYVSRATDDLRRLAEEEDADRITRYLYLLRLSESRDHEERKQWWDEYGYGSETSLGVLKTEVQLWRFGSGNSLPDVVTRSVLAELWQTTGSGRRTFHVFNNLRTFVARMTALFTRLDESEVLDDLPMFVDAPPSWAVNRFDADLSALEDQYRGPFLDAATYRSYFSGHFYSAIYQKAIHVLDRQAYVPSAVRVLETLEGAPAGVGTEMYRWYSHLTASEGGRGNEAELQVDLAELQLGEAQLDRTLDQLREHLDKEDFSGAAAAYVRRLDTRPDHRSSVASIAAPNLFDLTASDKYYRSLLEVAGSDYRRIGLWMARYDGDYETVLNAVADSTLDARLRKRALQLIVEAELADHDTIKRSAGILIGDFPDDWSIRRTFIDFLEDQRNYREGLLVIGDWLSQHDRRAGFDYINASNAMARFHYHLGEYQTALEYVMPVVNSWQAGSIGRAAIILGAMRRLREARDLADRLVRRYPGSAWGRSVLAEILWRQGQYSEVVPVLRPDGYRVWSTDWREHVARAFLSVFGNSALDEAEAAFTALLAGGIPSWVVDDLPAGLNEAGRPDLAFTLQSQLPPARSGYGMRQGIVAYGYLKAWRGDANAALQWLRPRIPRASWDRATLEIFSTEEDELLWDLITSTQGLRYSETVWLTRAAALVRSGGQTAAWRRALHQHYEQRSGDDYFVMGRYLLDLEDEAAMLSLATTPQRRCEVSFYMGIRAQAEGRYQEAHDWYRVVRATQSKTDYEYGWATDILDEWDDRDRSLVVLARQDRLE